MLRDVSRAGEAHVAWGNPLDAPELWLFAAILQDARMCLRDDVVHPRTRAAACRWIRGEVESAPHCSFVEICGVLGLDAGAVRRHLLRGVRFREPEMAAVDRRALSSRRRRARRRPSGCQMTSA
jgi:hypothetical protein